MTWLDTLASATGWEHGPPEIAPVTVVTVGILCKTKRIHVVLARDFYYDPDHGGLVTGGRIAIPTGMTVNIKRIGRAA